MGRHHHLPVGPDVVARTRRTEDKLCVTIVRWPCEPHQPSLSVSRVAGGVCAA